MKLLKILFFLCLFLSSSVFVYFALSNVNVPSETVVETIKPQRL